MVVVVKNVNYDLIPNKMSSHREFLKAETIVVLAETS